MGEPGVKLLKVDDIYKIKSCRTKCGRNSNQMNSVFNVKLNYFPSHNVSGGSNTFEPVLKHQRTVD